MKKLKSFIVFLLVITLMCGCESISSKDEAKEVKDDAVANLLRTYVSSIESSPKTIELYKNNGGTAKDYTNDDMLLVGLNTSLGLESDIELSPAQTAAFAKNNMKEVYSFIKSEDVEKEIKGIFGSTTVKNASSVGTCPKYIYNETQQVYYVQYDCTEQTKIVSYIDSIKKDGNLYILDVYTGFIENNIVYGNVEKNKVIQKLEAEESFTIDNTNKNNFAKFVYTFKKNSDGNYIFDSIKK